MRIKGNIYLFLNDRAFYQYQPPKTLVTRATCHLPEIALRQTYQGAQRSTQIPYFPISHTYSAPAQSRNAETAPSTYRLSTFQPLNRHVFI